MLNIGCIRVLKTQLKISRFLSNLPYSWDETHGQGSIGKLIYKSNYSSILSGKIRNRLDISLLLVFIWCPILYIRFTHLLIFQKDIPTNFMFSYVTWLVIYSGISSISITFITRHKEICLMFNGAVSLWYNNFRDRAQKGCLDKILALWMVVLPVTPFCFASLFWFLPCSPQFLYSMINNSACNSDIGWVTKSTFFLLETALLAPFWGFGPIMVFVMIPMLSCCNSFVKEIRKESSHGLKTTRKGIQYVCYREALLYRKAHILVKLFNECFQNEVLPTTLTVHAGFIITCLYVLIEQLDSEVEVPIYQSGSYLSLIMFSVGFEAFMMEYASGPILHSKAVKMEWRRVQRLEKNSWLAKFAKSCPILKIFTKPNLPIGRDKLAHFMRFCLQRTLFLLVYNKKRIA